MEHSQCHLNYRNDPRGRRRITRRYLIFLELDIPVTEIVPKEVVQQRNRRVELVPLKRTVYVEGRPVKPRDYPSVRQNKSIRPEACFIELRFPGVQQREPRRIPDL